MFKRYETRMLIQVVEDEIEHRKRIQQSSFQTLEDKHFVDYTTDSHHKAMEIQEEAIEKYKKILDTLRASPSK